MRITTLALLLSLLASDLRSDDARQSTFAAMSPDQVRAFEIEVMEHVADLALIPPTPNTSPLPEYDYDRLDYGMTIGIERTPGGRLWACWVAGGDSPAAYFVLATSDDDGATWSKPRMVLDSHSKKLPRERSILVGNLWTDPKGRLWLIFDQSMEMFDGRAGVWMAVCENPDADEPTWRGWRTTRDAGQALLTIGGAISSPRLSQHAPLEKPHEITRTCQTSDRLQREGPR